MDNKYKPVPFWSWNDELDENGLVNQIDWMNSRGIGGFFMHARGGLTTPYLGEKWFSCVEACLKRAKELDMEAYAYDENGWPSGFAGGKLLEDENNRDGFLTYNIGEYDPKAKVSYSLDNDELKITTSGKNCLNVYINISMSTADICNKEVVKKFINLTHEEYAKRDKYNNLRGFFTDEPQYYRWKTAYTKCLPDYFKEHYNEDIFLRLGLLFVEKEGYRDFRYKYWKAMQDLMLNAFAKQIYEWCDERGYKLTGHYVEENSLAGQMWCNAGIMPFYEYEHIPGMDWLSRGLVTPVAQIQLGSVCAQLDKKQILTETFACCGWDATPRELKRIAEYQYVFGPNLMCHHLLPYKEHGQRKRDYPEHYSAINPWAQKDFKQFNDYFSFLGEKLSKSTQIVNVGVFHPIRSCYFDFKREDCYESIKHISDSYLDVCKKLTALHLPFHYLDETLLAKYGKVEGKSLILGKCKYDYIIFSKTLTMDKTSEALLHEFVNNGGKVLLLDGPINYIEGNQYDYNYLHSNITLEEIVKAQNFTSNNDPEIYLTYRRDEFNNNYFYILNIGKDKDFILNGHKLHFKEWESRLIYEKDLKDDNDNAFEILTLNKKFNVSKVNKNYMAIDCLRYSLDGKKYSDILPHMGIFNMLLEKRYCGDLYLKYEFVIKEKTSIYNTLLEDTNVKEVYVNGKLITEHTSVLEKDLWKYDISDLVNVGHNEIIIKINFFEDENVYYALYGEGVTESLRNCLVYNTTIESIYLEGDFGVYGDFVPGKTLETIRGDNFYLAKQKDVISSLIEEGFPFFRGEIELTQNFNVTSDKVMLFVPERFQTIRVSINNQYVGLMMFDNYLDISSFINKGNNEIKLTLTVSNRNLLGPYHTYHTDEDLGVGPYSFERMGTWVDGRSNNYRDNYAFVKTIL